MKRIKKYNNDLDKILAFSKYYNTKDNLKRIDVIKNIIEELKKTLGNEIINKIIKSHKYHKSAQKYFEFLNLHRKYTSKEIHKKINVTDYLIRDWYKGKIPKEILSLLKIYFKNYHKIPKRVLSRLIGWGFGDGGISHTLQYFFICGKKNDLIKIKQYLKENIPHISLTLERNSGESIINNVDGKQKYIKGFDSWILLVKDASFSRLLYSYGLPKGNKTLQAMSIPFWIKNSSKKIKTNFLNSLFECELQKFRVQFNVKRNKVDICPITFGMSKIEKYKKNLIEFLEEIISMLDELNIKTTNIEKPKESNIRKDGLITYSTRFYISIAALNVIRFSKTFNFEFNEEKKKCLKEALDEANVKINRFNLQLDKYNKAVELYQNGLSLYKIAKKLEIEYSTTKHWLKTKEHLPYLLNEEVISNV